MQPTEPQQPVSPVSGQPSSEIATVSQPQQQPMQSFNQKKVKKSSHKIAILLAVVILLAISSAVVYFFITKQKNSQPVVEPAPQQTQPQLIDPASPEGVDQTIQSIDQSLNSVNDQRDFTPNDISDDKLGL